MTIFQASIELTWSDSILIFESSILSTKLSTDSVDIAASIDFSRFSNAWSYGGRCAAAGRAWVAFSRPAAWLW
jgi:hypothetical protein